MELAKDRVVTSLALDQPALAEVAQKVTGIKEVKIGLADIPVALE